MDLKLGVPVCLRSFTGSNLLNESMTKIAHCRNTSSEIWEQMLLLQCDDGKFIIQSRWNGRNLQVLPDGKCVFANRDKMQREKFDVESDKHENIYFISCHTGKVMQCSDSGSVWCLNKIRQSSKAWRIIYPGRDILISPD